MSPPFRLQPLLDLSKMRLDEASRELGKLIAGEQEASQRLAMLMQYRDEYQAQFRAAAERGMGPAEWSNYSSFLARIDDAIVPAAPGGLHDAATHLGRKTELGRQTGPCSRLRYAG